MQETRALSRQLIVFSIPLILSGLLQQMFNWADAFIVGNVLGEDALAAIADKAIEMKLGARGLRGVMESIMTEVMYEVPSDPTIEKVVITADCVRGGSKPAVYRKTDNNQTA